LDISNFVVKHVSWDAWSFILIDHFNNLFKSRKLHQKLGFSEPGSDTDYIMPIPAQTYPIWCSNATKAKHDKNYAHKQKYRNNLIAKS
jgi:hypothetical protein